MNISAFVRDRELASRIAKLGTESDIALFNYKEGEKHLNVISPIRYPDKLSSLMFSLHMSDMAVLDISEVNRELGEIIVALNSLKMAEGAIILKNYLLPEQIEPFIRDTALKNYKILEDDHEKVREFLFSMMREEGNDDGPVRVVIDHYFPVKGVGLVALGIVESGTVEKHQKLRLYPTDKEAHIKSIQVHDVDVSSAGAGSRVGLALKNVKEGDMERGMVLADGAVDVFDGEVKLEVEVSPFFGKELAKGDVLHIFAGLQMIPARITGGSTAAGKKSILSVVPEKRFADYNGMKKLLVHIDSQMPRIIGPFSVFRA
jgi:selenocysteine-specific translation elongation factor